MAGSRWKVVGGADKGGILVREGRDLTSEQLEGRLATGSLVEAVKVLGERLQYVILEGEGPQTGWVSSKLKGKALLERLDAWRDLSGKSLGPWSACGDKVTAVHFDRSAAPPERSRTLYVASQGIESWQLSEGSVEPPPRAQKRLETLGVVSDFLLLSGRLVTAVSANPPPEVGSVCHQADFKKRMAEQDDLLRPGDQLSVLDLSESTSQPQRIKFHTRGCQKLSLGPRFADLHQLASISKDMLVVSTWRENGLQERWSAHEPHGEATAKHLSWESPERLWSSDSTGCLRLWDIASGQSKPSVELPLHLKMISSLLYVQPAGLLLAAHEEGLSFVDTRSKELIRTQYTKEPVATAAVQGPESQGFFAAVGCSVLHYELRRQTNAAELKNEAVGLWGLPAKVTALDCLDAGAGKYFVAAGCEDGRVAVFDAT